EPRRRAAGPGLQPRAGHLRGGRVHVARLGRARHGPHRAGLPPRGHLDRLHDDPGRRAGGAPGRGPADHRPFAGGRRVPGPVRRLRPRGLRPLLQRRGQSHAVVHPALPLGPVERSGRAPQRGRGLRVRLQRRQRGPGARRHRRDRGGRRTGGDGPRLPPVHAARDGPPGAARRLPAPLHPHPVDPVRRLARAPARHARGALRRPAGQRHHRLPHVVLPAQLPAVLRGPAGPRRRPRRRHRPPRGPRRVGAQLSAADRRPRHAASRPVGARGAVRGRAAAPPPRQPDPPGGPRGPVEERPARVLGLRPVPRPAPRVQR
ncbi:MAG: Alpha,alpha-trehalose-phosphate synthase [UDP-forming], partial [uncultured Thermoleophilia bacterium]